MARDPRYDILFEPIKIGPKTAKNRFYQVPHCNGFGHAFPHADAAFRGMKAEGGWAVVCTEQCTIHPTSDAGPYPETRIWNDEDIAPLALFCDKVHEHGSLAGIELAHNGFALANLHSKEAAIGPTAHVPLYDHQPYMGRAMDLEDIKEFRRWQVEAAKRALKAGFDLVYVYCGHDIAVPQHFLSRMRNQRSDEYGGSLENRMRLLREMIEDTQEAVGDRAAVVVRFAVEENLGPMGITYDGEAPEVIGRLAELPDLWDVNVSNWDYDSNTSRFAPEGDQEKFVAFVKKLTTKPVVGVGRFTSPDVMVSQIERGVLDMIGAARPSIADPFLPKKIEEGRFEDIRECIGCNMCAASQMVQSPIRCTQNPTSGEEWRRGWHPEKIARKGSDSGVLVVGSGPAGLEAARALGARGYEVHLMEAESEVGGRALKESRLPGLAAWARVATYRTIQIGKMKNVEVHTGARLSAQKVLEYGAEVVVVATGAKWRKDGVALYNDFPIKGSEGPNVHTPDDVMAGKAIEGPVIVFDDDHFYMGGVVAEKLRRDGLSVILATPVGDISKWCYRTLDIHHIHHHLLDIGVELVMHKNLGEVREGEADLVCPFTGRRETRKVKSVVMVTSRQPQDALYNELKAAPEKLKRAGIKTLKPLGDCFAPATIQAAVFNGHKLARELDGGAVPVVSFKRERIALGNW
jgi:dimethylamine/trimethylamine dehydrogenase